MTRTQEVEFHAFGVLLAIAACTGAIEPVIEPEPCVTYLVTELGDTARFVDLEVPPENLSGVVTWWTEGDCPCS